MRTVSNLPSMNSNFEFDHPSSRVLICGDSGAGKVSFTNHILFNIFERQLFLLPQLNRKNFPQNRARLLQFALNT